MCRNIIMAPFTTLFLCALLQATALATDCPEVTYEECGDGQQSCSLGYDADTGCDYGSYCMDTVDANTNCALFCPVIYDPSKEYECAPAQDPETGCYAPPTTVSLGVDGSCPGVCPELTGCFGSSSSAIYCPLWDPETGCDLGGHCEEPAVSNDGSPCPIPTCPISPPAVNERVCFDYDTVTGCPLPPYTVPMEDPENGVCGGICVSERDCTAVSKQAVYCSAVDPATGCELMGYCQEPIKDINNEACPNVFCMNDMAIEGEYTCTDWDDQGCPTAQYTVPIGNITAGICPGFCNDMYDCGDDGTYCPSMDADDVCDMGGSCAYPMVLSDEVTCPAMCPLTSCPTGMQVCYLGFDDNGCDMGGYCSDIDTECA